ncbi:MAG: COX15/CtaA family protein [Pseudomonadales bacterium]|nr:COX15/CtaA family protein [Pseudomonadales bacterium]
MQRLVCVATLLALIVVALGAYTRLKDAGLGCPDWPGCYGFLTVPEHVDDIAIAEARYPHAPVEPHKGWPEMIHRYAASLLGLVILVHAVIAMRIHTRAMRDGSGDTTIKSQPVFSFMLLLLVIAQGMFGMWTVTLQLWPQVVATHLLGGFATLSLLFLLWLQRTQPPVQSTQRSPQFKALKAVLPLGFIAIVLVVMQIFLGAWTAANYAAVACPDFPTCQGQYLPDMDFKQGFDITQAIGPNYLGGTMDNAARVAIHVSHRIGALLVSLYLIGLCIFTWRKLTLTWQHPLAKALCLVMAALTTQITLGIVNVMWLIPLPIALAHNLGGAALLLSLVFFNFQLYRLRQLHDLPAQAHRKPATGSVFSTPSLATTKIMNQE